VLGGVDRLNHFHVPSWDFFGDSYFLYFTSAFLNPKPAIFATILPKIKKLMPLRNKVEITDTFV
jgi:hypothetical protein